MIGQITEPGQLFINPGWLIIKQVFFRNDRAHLIENKVTDRNFIFLYQKLEILGVFKKTKSRSEILSKSHDINE